MRKQVQYVMDGRPKRPKANRKTVLHLALEQVVFAFIDGRLGKLPDHHSTNSQADSVRSHIGGSGNSLGNSLSSLNTGLSGAAGHCLAASDLDDRTRGAPNVFVNATQISAFA